jgi:hypothetical protein
VSHQESSVALKIEWNDLGPITLDDDDKLVFPIRDVLDEHKSDGENWIPDVADPSGGPLPPSSLTVVAELPGAIEAFRSSLTAEEQLKGLKEPKYGPLGLAAVYRFLLYERREDWDGDGAAGSELLVRAYVGQTNDLYSRMSDYRSQRKATDIKVGTALAGHLQPITSELNIIERRTRMTIVSKAVLTTRFGERELHLLANIERLLVEGAAVFDLIELGYEHPELLNEISG